MHVEFASRSSGSNLPKRTSPKLKTTSMLSEKTIRIAALCLAMTPACFADDSWTGSRGDGSGVAKANVPTQWSPTEGGAWQTSIPGYGQSSPVVWNNNVYVNSSEGPFQEDCQVHAFDLHSGKKLWTSHIEATTIEKSCEPYGRLSFSVQHN